MNGVEYKVEDTGNFAQYGVAFDVYYDDHNAALNHGHQTWEAYLSDANGSQEIEVTTTTQQSVFSVTLAIGRKVADIAKVFGCNVIYYSTSGKNNNAEYESADLDTLLAKSDIVSVHAPLNAVTENLMNLENLRKMKSSAILINVARGPVVNEVDLVIALEEGIIAGAGLDVISAEPMKADNPLLKIQDSGKLIVTPHIAWATGEARQRCTDEVYLNIEAFMRGEERNLIP